MAEEVGANSHDNGAIETTYRSDVTFEIVKIRLLRTPEQQWFEIRVKITDENGTRETIVREGDVLRAIFQRTHFTY